MKAACLLSALLAVLFLAACSTPRERRIRQNAAVVNSLDQNTQVKISAGVIEVGFTEQMVMIALGQPDRKSEKVSESGKETTWTYLDYKDQAAGSSEFGITHSPGVPATDTQRGTFGHNNSTEVRESPTQSGERSKRVTFKGGKVISWEYGNGKMS